MAATPLVRPQATEFCRCPGPYRVEPVDSAVSERNMPAKAKSKIRVGIGGWVFEPWRGTFYPEGLAQKRELRSEEHTSELQSLMRISYAGFCLKKKTNQNMR